MLSEINDKEVFAEQIYSRYLSSAYLINADYNEDLIDNLSLSIDTANLCSPLNKCINETC